MNMLQNRYVFWLFTLLLAVLLPSTTLAWSFSVSPSEVEIENLSPGNKAEFKLSIYNKESINQVFYLSSYLPDETDIRQGRTVVPDNSWISLPAQVKVTANSEKEITIAVSIPQNQEWKGKDWEIWLGISPETPELLVINYYVRLLLSTGEATNAASHSAQLVIIVSIVVLFYVLCSYYRKAHRNTIR